MNVYIWNNEWSVNRNTLAYYPLASDVNDYSGNSRNGTNTGVTFSDGISGTFNGSSYITIPYGTILGNTFTVSMYYKYSSGGNTAMDLFSKGPDNNYNGIVSRTLLLSGYVGQYTAFFASSTTISGNALDIPNSGLLDTQWHNIAFTFDSGMINVYKDGTQIGTKDLTNQTFDFTGTGNIVIGKYSQSNLYYVKGNISAVIIESIPRTSDQVQGYFNQTKSLYGIS